MLVARPSWQVALDNDERESIARLVTLAIDRQLGTVRDALVGQDLLMNLGYLGRNGVPSPEALDWLHR